MVELSRCAALRGGRLWSTRGRGVSRAQGEAGRWETGWQGESFGGVGRTGWQAMKTPPPFGHPSLQRYDEHLSLRSVSRRTREESGRFLRVLARHTGCKSGQGSCRLGRRRPFRRIWNPQGAPLRERKSNSPRRKRAQSSGLVQQGLLAGSAAKQPSGFGAYWICFHAASNRSVP